MATMYSTALRAWAYAAGDLTIAPAADAVPTFRTAVGVRSGEGAAVTPDDFGFYRSGVWVNSIVTQNGVPTFTTTVLVGQKRRSLIDGRADILSAGRYRR